MNDLQISMIDNQAAAIARDALDSGDLMVRQLADDTLALIAEVRRLRTELDAVPEYLFWCLLERDHGESVFPSLGDWIGEQQAVQP